jgi:Rtf2 RING-finger
MGNDGGSIPKRIELVKEKKKAAVQNPDIERRAVWFFCALSKVKPPLIMPPNDINPTCPFPSANPFFFLLLVEPSYSAHSCM